MGIAEISVEQMRTRMKEAPVVLLDVRTPLEFRFCHASGATNLPLDQLDPEKLGICKEQSVYVICKSGKRAAAAAQRLQQLGYRNVYNVSGGTDAWKAANLPVEVTSSRFQLSQEQQVRAIIGLLTAVGAMLAFWQTAFVVVPLVMGLGLLFAGVTDSCLMAMIVAKLPWNQQASGPVSCSIGRTRPQFPGSGGATISDDGSIATSFSE